MSEPRWLQTLRGEARASFETLGLPTSQLEDWRYTARALRPLGELELESAACAEPSPDRGVLEEIASPLFACSEFAFVDGHFDEALSTPRGLSGDLPVRSLRALIDDESDSLAGALGQLARPKEDAFAALNTAHFEDGALVHIARDRDIAQPLHLVFVTRDRADGSTHPRIAVRAEAGSRATLIVDFVSAGDGRCFTNSLLEIDLAENAELDLVVLQRECNAALHVSRTYVRQGRDSRLRAHTLTLGGRSVRNDLEVVLADEGAEVVLNGLFLGLGEQHIDNHTLVDHAVPHCTSRELYKGVLADRARGVFRGRVVVRPDAQKTAAEQSNPNLLIGDRAEIDTKPQLEIYADDVRCSHGATIGQLDEDALFYLRARGIANDPARLILIQAFAAEISDALPAEALGERVREMFLQRLAGATA
ncbi:MAG: Fe-S cluster assembly protein SufD [Myxococcota bacterium]|nr:Fe-S cluster assembly protein SufD [Myxococcota bacterium]